MAKLKDIFGVQEIWEKEWQGMPEFVQKDLTPFKSIYVHFKRKEDIDRFSKLVNQKITIDTKFIWYPKVKPTKLREKIYVDNKQMSKNLKRKRRA